MKHNYLMYIILLGIILMRNPFINFINNLTGKLFVQETNLEHKILLNKNEFLLSEYEELLSFKNNIKLEYEYQITNIVKNNYGFSNLIINGVNYKLGDEVVNNEGLIGIITKINQSTSEIKYIYETNLIVRINNEIGKITEKDENNNIIIKEISNYNNIKINDYVYSTNNTYIGKVIKIKYDVLDNYLTVKTINMDNLNYVAVISR